MGWLLLICHGTIKDLEKHGIVLQEGLALTFYMDEGDESGNRDDLLVDGIVKYNEVLKCWVADIDENTFRHISEVKDSN
jgi:hypothetical protein